MKNQNIQNKLAFNKVVITELSHEELTNVNGGTTSLCIGTIITLLIIVT